jgi:hypothetical protein
MRRGHCELSLVSLKEDRKGRQGDQENMFILNYLSVGRDM